MNKHLKRIVLSTCSEFIIPKLKYYQELVELQVSSNQTLALYKGVIYISQVVYIQSCAISIRQSRILFFFPIENF